MRSSPGEWREIVLLLVLGLFAVGASPDFVAEFRISPDSLEYVAGARALLEHGRFELPLGEPALPPRYPPAFSALWIAPVLSTGVGLGWAIIPVTLSALLALLCAFRIGTLIGGVWGGTASALAVLVVPGFVFFSRQVLIDIPTTMLVLGGGVIFLRLRGATAPCRGLVTLGGLIVGCSVSLRPTGLILAIPLGLALLRSPHRKVANWALFLLPIGAAVGAGMLYNFRTFGDVFRSGYNYWCGIPYDFASLTFGLRYCADNAAAIFIDSGLAALITFLVGCFFTLHRTAVRVGDTTRDFALYTGVVGLPLIGFYLLYFFPSVRFVVPVSTLVAILVGGTIGALLESRGVRSFGRFLVLLALLVVVGGYRFIARDLRSVKGEAAKAIRDHTAAKSVVISGIDPVYLGLMVGVDREYLPISRRVEYASKFLIDKWLTIDPSDVEPRCENPDVRLLEHGARQAVPRVALEAFPYVAEALSAGRAVYLDTSQLKREERAEIESRLLLIERAPNLFVLQPKVALKD